MPELPEVENVKKGIIQDLNFNPGAPTGQTLTIVSFEPQRADLRFPFPREKEIKDQLLQKPLLRIYRRAKYLIFETQKGSLLCHLGMTGTWRKINNKEKGNLKTHDHLIIGFSNGVFFVYNDPRRFGFVELFVSDSQFLKKLGPEPLEKDFSFEYLKSCQKRKSDLPIKVWLMQQQNVVGVGNIYASEALFLAKISPKRKIKNLKAQELKVLVEKIKLVLSLAIEAGGSSISDFKNINGQSGYFQKAHKVYARKGEPCLVCKAPIRQITQSGRSTFYCHVCQK